MANYINLTDPPKLNSLSKNERLALIYNEVVNHIARLKQSGRLKEGQNLNAEAITSQIILESGWANSSLTNRINNFGGLTAGKAWKGPVETVENDPFTGGTYHYRVYKTPIEGIRAQVEFYLPDVNPRYEKAGVLNASNADEHFARVKAAGYAEDPNYVSKLSSFIRSTIRPRLRASVDEDAIANWYAEQSDYEQNENYAQQLNEQEQNIQLQNQQAQVLINEAENEAAIANAATLRAQQEQQQNAQEIAEQSFQEYEKAGQQQSFPSLDQRTLNTLNLSENQFNPVIENITGPQTQIFSDDVAKERAEQDVARMKKEQELQNFINSSIVTGNRTPLFGQGQLFGAEKRAGGSINIKPENKGKFTAKANAAGMGVQAFANKVLGASEGTYSPSTRRQANFARNASKWNRGGGSLYSRYYEPGGPMDSGNIEDLIGEENMLINKPGYKGKPIIPKLNDYMNPVMFNIDPETENIKVYDPKTGTYKVSDRKFDFSDEAAIGYPMSHISDIYEADDQSPEALAAREEKALMQLELAKEQASGAMKQIGERASKSAENLESLGQQGVAQSYINWLGGGYQCMSGTSACFAPNPNNPNEVSQNLVTMPYYSSKDFGLNKPKSSIGTRKTGQGTTSPGDPIPTISGNESFASWYPQLYGFQMLPPQSPVETGQVHVLHGYEKPHGSGYSDNFVYGKGGGSYHAQTVAEEDLLNKEFNITNNPVFGPFRNAYYLDSNQPVDRGTAQFNYVGDTRVYEKILDDIRSKRNLAKND